MALIEHLIFCTVMVEKIQCKVIRANWFALYGVWRDGFCINDGQNTHQNLVESFGLPVADTKWLPKLFLNDPQAVVAKWKHH